MTSERDQRDCANCGANVASLSARFCEYCGNELPRPSSSTHATPAPGPHGDLPARFRALEDDPSYPELMQRTPEIDPSLGSGLVMMIVVTVFIAAVALGMATMFAFVCAPLGIVPLAIGGLAVTFAIKHWNETSRIKGATLVRRAALVADERTHVSGGGNTSSRTRYYVTLEFPDGQRDEVYTLGKTAGEISPGDLGVAYLEDRLLVAFERVAV